MEPRCPPCDVVSQALLVLKERQEYVSSPKAMATARAVRLDAFLCDDAEHAAMSYKKGIVLEIQFPPDRLNDGAGDPYWIDLTLDEARRLHDQLARRFAGEAQANQPLDTFTIE